MQCLSKTAIYISAGRCILSVLYLSSTSTDTLKTATKRLKGKIYQNQNNKNIFFIFNYILDQMWSHTMATILQETTVCYVSHNP